MNWDYIFIAAAIAASLIYLAKRRSSREGTRAACDSSPSGCACCPRAPAKRPRVRREP